MIAPQAVLPLIAGAGDVFGLLVFVLLVVIGLVSKLIEAGNQKQKNRFPQQQGNRDVLQQEIDRFRNARQQQAQQQQGGNVDFSRPAAARHEQIPVQPVVEAEVIHQPIGVSVANEARQFESRVQQSFDHAVGGLKNDDLGELTSSLQPGTVPIQAEVISAQTAAGSQSNLAREIVDLLRTPRGVQQAVILSEIFQRPEDRWK